MRAVFTSLIFLIFSQLACAQDSFLALHSGGGITGSSNFYELRKNGNILKGRGVIQKEYLEQARLKKSHARKYFRKAKKLFKTNGDFIHPGNVYYSISLTDKDKKIERKITWGDSEHAVPENAKKLYDQLIAEVSSLRFFPNK